MRTASLRRLHLERQRVQFIVFQREAAARAQACCIKQKLGTLVLPSVGARSGAEVGDRLCSAHMGGPHSVNSVSCPEASVAVLQRMPSDETQPDAVLGSRITDGGVSIVDHTSVLSTSSSDASDNCALPRAVTNSAAARATQLDAPAVMAGICQRLSFAIPDSLPSDEEVVASRRSRDRSAAAAVAGHAPFKERAAGSLAQCA